jgi:hypothetical protein
MALSNWLCVRERACNHWLIAVAMLGKFGVHKRCCGCMKASG